MKTEPIRAVQTQPLREALPGLEPNLALACRRFFASPRGAQLRGGEWRIDFGYVADPYAACSEMIDLRCGSDTFELGLSHDDTAETLGDQQWQDFVWESRLVAWTAAHETLLAALAELFGAALPERLKLSDTARGAGQQLFWLSFEIADAERIRCRGVIGMPRARIDTVLPLLATPSGASRSLQLSLVNPIALDGPQLSAQRLSQLQVGDVVVLGTTEQTFAAVRLQLNGAPDASLNARWDQHGLRVVQHQLNDRATRESDMSKQISDTDDSASAVSPIANRTIPVNLQFQVGEVTLQLAELEQLQAGYVFDLARPVEGAETTIFVNGQAVGHGELVAAGDSLGVRVLRWENDGLQ